jgi:hypothetical protein
VFHITLQTDTLKLIRDCLYFSFQALQKSVTLKDFIPLLCDGKFI